MSALPPGMGSVSDAPAGSGASAVARVNGVPLNRPQEALAPEELRQRACTELLRQAAQDCGLLDAGDAPSADGVISQDASAAIEALLERNLSLPEPSEDACRRHFAANPARYQRGERAHLRHILFAVTPGVDVVALRKHAEGVLLNVRCRDEGDSAQDADPFAHAARTLSNCPSGAAGGNLGWLTAEDCAPEFAREVFGRAEVGVLPRLVHSRFGLHVIEVLERQAGAQQSFESVRGAVAAALRQQSFATALRQYLSLLAGAARVEGVDLEASASPLVN